MIAILAAFSIGTVAGFLIAALCTAAQRADEANSRLVARWSADQDEECRLP